MAAGIRRKAASLKPLERRFSKKRNHADVSGGRYDRGPRRINEHSRTAVQKSLQTQLRRGFRGYPVATIAYYGPDDAHASKVAVGIVRGDGEAVAELRRWSSAETDVRLDTMINREIVDFIQVQGGAQWQELIGSSVALTRRVWTISKADSARPALSGRTATGGQGTVFIDPRPSCVIRHTRRWPPLRNSAGSLHLASGVTLLAGARSQPFYACARR